MRKRLPTAAALLLLAGTGLSPAQADEHQGENAQPMNEEGTTTEARDKERNEAMKRGPGNAERGANRDMTEGQQQGQKAMKENRGLEKQRERVMEQEQKELGKGSEQGQESRENRRKWWRFWE